MAWRMVLSAVLFTTRVSRTVGWSGAGALSATAAGSSPALRHAATTTSRCASSGLAARRTAATATAWPTAASGRTYAYGGASRSRGSRLFSGISDGDLFDAQEPAPAGAASVASSDADVGAPSAPSSLSALSVAQLKDMCRERGLLVGGKKAELVERLEAAGASGGADASDGAAAAVAPQTAPAATAATPPPPASTETPASTGPAVDAFFGTRASYESLGVDAAVAEVLASGECGRA